MGMGSGPIIHIRSGVIAAIVESTTRILVVRSEATLYFGLYLYGQRPTPCQAALMFLRFTQTTQ